MIQRLFKPQPLPFSVSVTFLLLRIVMGVAFVIHGWGKIQSPFSWMPPDAGVPGFMQLLAAVSEFGGGLSLILGLLTPLSMLGLAITMAVAASMHAFVLGDPFVSTGAGAYELPLVYLCVAIIFIVTGPGKLSLDWLIFKKH